MIRSPASPRTIAHPRLRPGVGLSREFGGVQLPLGDEQEDGYQEQQRARGPDHGRPSGVHGGLLERLASVVELSRRASDLWGGGGLAWGHADVNVALDDIPGL